MSANLSAQNPTPASEYDIKAAMLLKLPAYVTWPERESPGVCQIGVLGEDPFGKRLDELAEQSSTEDLRFEVRRGRDLGSLGGADVIFVSRALEDSVNGLMRELADQPVLTVSDIDRFSEQGGIVTLRIVERRVRLTINKAASERAELEISSKLLQLADIVGDGDDEGGA